MNAPSDRALWFVGPGRAELRPGPPPGPPAPGELVVRALASGVSQGTELLLYKGEAPTPFDPSLEAPGTPLYPRRYGYAWVGEVAEAGPGTALAPGRRVFALAPHGDVHRLAERSVRPLPEALPPERAVLAANLETAVTVVWDAGVGLGDRVVVLGGGVVGLLTCLLARRSGASSVRLVERSPARRAAARALGLDEVLAPEDDEPRGDADAVIEATGRPEALDRAIAHAGFEAAVTVASFYGTRQSPVALGQAFHRKRLALRSSQVSHLPPARAPRWGYDRRFALVVELLADGRLDALLDAVVPFDDAPQAYARAATSAEPPLQIVFRYRRTPT
ncbi:MAG TPA: zinc-binding alcohol dehydrogenase [Polyangiaceae bacterium]|nr:zinc-binding alcohol dehydrogenase [Polyangiaceae bacterium]